MKDVFVVLLMIVGVVGLVGCSNQQQYYEPYSEPCSNCHTVEQINKYRDNDIPLQYHQQFEQAKMIAFKRMRVIENGNKENSIQYQ